MELKTNMNDSQLFTTFLRLQKECDLCRMAHHNCRVLANCAECEKHFWIKTLANHFGVNLSSCI